MAVIDVLGGKLRRRFHRSFFVVNPVIAFVLVLQAAQDQLGLFHGGLGHLDLLEPARKRAVLVEELAVILVRGGANAAQLPRGQHRLEEVGGVHGAAGHGAGADHRVDFIDEQYCVFLFLQLLDDLLQPLLEIPPGLRAGKEGPEVQGIDAGFPKRPRHFSVHDHLRKAFGDGRLATPGSPTWMGLFLSLRLRTWMVRCSISSLPISGSIPPERAFSVRSTVYAARARAALLSSRVCAFSSGFSSPSSSSSAAVPRPGRQSLRARCR